MELFLQLVLGNDGVTLTIAVGLGGGLFASRSQNCDPMLEGLTRTVFFLNGSDEPSNPAMRMQHP